MIPRTTSVVGACLGFLLILTPGCSKKSSNPTAPQALDPTSATEAIQQAGTLQPPAEYDRVDSTSIDNGNTRTVTETHDVSKNIQEITYLGLNDDIVWAGNLIKGQRAHEFVYEPIVGVARNPVTLSINLEGSGSGTTVSKVVADPKLSTVRQGISDLLTEVLASGTSYAARAQFNKQQVYSESQLSLMVGANIKYGAGSLDTKFNWNSTTRKTKIIAKYQQLYYTIDMDTPKTPSDVFASNNTLDAIKASIPPGSCPMYVAGVTYGMMALTFIETDYSASDMQVSLDAAYSSGLLDVEIRSGLTKRQVLANSSISTVVYGGSSAGLGNIEEGYEGFIKAVHASIALGTASPGVPLIYKFRHLANNNLAAVNLTSQYSITRVIQLKQLVRIVAKRLFMEWGDDDCGDSVLEMDRFYIKANATQRTSATDPGTRYCVNDTLLYQAELPGYGQQMNTGDERVISGAVVFQLDAEHHNFTLATIKIWAKVRDYDPLCADDWAEATLTVPAGEIGQTHNIMLYGTDYRMRCEVATELVTPASSMTVARRRW